MSELKWSQVRKHCEDEIARNQRLLEAVQPEESSNIMRGEIRALRRLLALEDADKPADPRKTVQPATPDF